MSSDVPVSKFKYLANIQIAIFAGGVDTSATETKGTVLIHSAEQVCACCEKLLPLLYLS
jgi:hypothetical protein